MWLAIVVFVSLFIYYFAVKPLKYWKSRGVPYSKPLPFVGNLAEVVLLLKPIGIVVQNIYNAFPDKRYVGFYQFNYPTLLIRDPDMIKLISVKDFDAFPAHRTVVTPDVDHIWCKNLFAIKDLEKWQRMRSTLSPSFTSSKIKMMFELMKQCSKQFVQHFERDGGAPEVEIRDALTRYANDVIATAAFGVAVDSLKDKDNQFYLMGKAITNFRGIKVLKFFLAGWSPIFMKLIHLRILPTQVVKFFDGVVSETIRVRQEKGIVRPDMIHLLREAQKSRDPQKIEITDEDILAQAIVFFVAGFETTSTFMCFMCYELAVNPDIQEKLRGEIDRAYENSNEDITYDSLMGIKYLDMISSEILRKWPPVVVADRVNTRPYTIEPELPGEEPVTLEANTNIWFPVFALHRDPNYFPDPEKFDPERFSDENKDKINPYVYSPFGIGPRNCIASRFALLEGKLIIAEILRKFEIVPVLKTKIPMELDPGSFLLHAKDGVWLGLKLRS